MFIGLVGLTSIVWFELSVFSVCGAGGVID
jgi:hypothetical protein